MKQKLQSWALILVYTVVLWFGFITSAAASNQLSQSESRHILERLSFGITPEQIKQVETNGIEAYIQSQLNPQSIQESPILKAYLAEFNSTYREPVKLRQKLAANNHELRNALSRLTKKQRQKIHQDNRELKAEAQNRVVYARLARAVYSSRQLQEVMVDFWFNHFNVFADKGAVGFWLEDYERGLRSHALGKFQDLLVATASHPAMLIYLDNRINTDPNSPVARGDRQGLNENYARELLELHTLGVDGGYSQDDIVALARIFTGWGINYKSKSDRDGFAFRSKRHDPGDKVFLGHKITAGGRQEGLKALEILATHPATARFISFKLAQYFVADRPPSSLVDSLAQKFLESDGDIKVVMDALIHSPEFNDPQYSKQKFKTPYQYIVSLVRMGEIEQPNWKRIQGMLRQLSMPLYLCVPPTGYANTQEAWLNPQSMLQRITFATAIAQKALNPESPLKYQEVVKNLGELSPQTKQAVANSPKLSTALVLGSPEAMYR